MTSYDLFVYSDIWGNYRNCSISVDTSITPSDKGDYIKCSTSDVIVVSVVEIVAITIGCIIIYILAMIFIAFLLSYSFGFRK